MELPNILAWINCKNYELRCSKHVQLRPSRTKIIVPTKMSIKKHIIIPNNKDTIEGR